MDELRKDARDRLRMAHKCLSAAGCTVGVRGGSCSANWMLISRHITHCEVERLTVLVRGGKSHWDDGHDGGGNQEGAHNEVKERSGWMCRNDGDNSFEERVG